MTLRDRARYLRNEAWLRVRTDWPVWAVLAVSAAIGCVVGWRAGSIFGWYRGVGFGLFAGWAALGVLICCVLGPAYDSGRREERDRRRR